MHLPARLLYTLPLYLGVILPVVDSAANPIGQPPDTGVTRYYDFTVSRTTKSPDGFNKSMLVVNDQFPGPLIEANWGDMIEITVHNAIENPEEGTSIHWHGMPQSKTPWYDGVPSVHQCPIAPGESFVYTFQAEEFGTTWWHSHYSAQYMDGVFGPMIIHGPKYYDYDTDLGAVQLTDYTHTEYFSYLLHVYDIPPDFLPVDSNLINGLMPFNCSLAPDETPCDSKSAQMAKFQFQAGKTHLLRLINAGGSGSQKFSIDDHELTVVANDFTLVEPYTTKVVTLGPGQRSDILVKATGKPTDSVWMRADLDPICLNVTSYQPNARAIVYYDKASPDVLPDTDATGWESNNCANDPLEDTVPLISATPSTVPDVSLDAIITVGTNGSGNLVFFYNNSTFYADYSDPLLLEAWSGNVDFPDHPDWNVYNFGNATSIRLVVYNYYPVMHNMHLHGYSFWVLAEGTGIWNGTITNPQNPQRRDGQQLMSGTAEAPTYIVIQWDATNPGVWPFHCHLVVHASAGLYANLIMRPDLIQTDQDLPGIVNQTCNAWDVWAANNDVTQIDSGLKHKRDVSSLVPRKV